MAAKDKFPILSIGQSAALSALAIKVALQALQGHKVPQAIRVPSKEVTSANLQEGKTYYPNVPDSFFDGINIAGCKDLQFDAQAILKEKI
jgi:ribose transport system substrate-binding protein